MRKRILPFLLLTASIFMWQSANAAYCTIDKKVNETCSGYVNIDNVHSHSLQGITIKVGGATVLTQEATKTTFNWLSGSKSFTVKQGQEMEITFTNGRWSKDVWIGCDWNGDEDYEYVYDVYPDKRPDAGTESVKTVTIMVPPTANIGTTRIRFVSDGEACTTQWNPVTPMCGTHGTGVLGYAGSVHEFGMKIEVGDTPIPERTITLKASPASGGTVSGGGTSTTAISCTATPAAGYLFVNWTNEATGAVLSTSTTYYDNTEGDKTLIANFARDPKIDRSGWTASADSQSNSGADGPAGYAIDGNNSTWWHSQYNPTTTAQPHWIMFDLGKSQSFTSFNYISRSGKTDSSGNGNIGQYELYASDNEADVKGYLESAKVNSGTFTYNGGAAQQEHKINIDAPARGRYVLLKSITAANGLAFAACAEFYLYLDAFVVSVASADENMGDVYIDTKGNKSKELSTDGDEAATLTAEPVEGYHFVSWTLDGAEVSTEAVYTTDLVTESREYVANFAFTPVEPRQVTVVSSDNSKGSVAIISPETEETSINTGDIVIVEASPANSDNFFVNWTDGSGNVLGTSTAYKYDKAPAITMTANFVTKYIINANQSAGGTMTVKSGGVTITTGDRVADGSILTISIKPDSGKGLDQLFINGVDVYVEGQDVYTTTVAGETTIMPVYGAPKCRLYYSYEGAGYIEVWSADTYQEDGPFPVDPDGEQYGMEDLLPYGENVYIFVYPYNGSTLQSLLVDGEEKFDHPDLIEYGDLERGVANPIHIKAVFSGVSTGVENSVSEAGVKVYGVSGGIVINSESAVTAEIFTAGGELIATPSVSGSSTVSVASGFYIVRVNGASYKVSVK